MNINVQPELENEKTILYPLQEKDFEALYALASDPKIWEQHPNNDRWKKEVFKTFFDLVMQSKGAFKIVDKTTDSIVGKLQQAGKQHFYRLYLLCRSILGKGY